MRKLSVIQSIRNNCVTRDLPFLLLLILNQLKLIFTRARVEILVEFFGNRTNLVEEFKKKKKRRRSRTIVRRSTWHAEVERKGETQRVVKARKRGFLASIEE